MARTTTEAVSKIIEVDSNINSGDLEVFIETANALVTEVCVPADYEAARLELIERWLSAHFYALRDQRLAAEKAGPVSANYQYKLGLMLSSTMYGQQALILDTAGGLARLSKSAEEGNTAKPSMTWLGSTS